MLLVGVTYAVVDAAHDPPGRAQPAAQRGRVAGVGGRHLPRQDRHPHRGDAAGGGGGARRRRRRGRVLGAARAVRRELAEPHIDPRRRGRVRARRARADRRERPVRLAAAVERRAHGRAHVRPRRARSTSPSGSGSTSVCAPSRRPAGGCWPSPRATCRSTCARPTTRPRPALEPARPRGAGRGAARRRARDDRLPARGGHPDPGDLGRRPRDGRGDRRRRRDPPARRAARRTRPAPRRRRDARPGAGDRRGRADLTRGQEALRGGARGRRLARRDGGRRRQRRAGPEGGAPGDRAGQRLADGPRHRRPDPRDRRLRLAAADDPRGPQGAAQPAARGQALRREVGACRVPRSHGGALVRELPLPPPPPDAGLGDHHRHPGVLPRPGAERRRRGGPIASCASWPASPSPRGRRSAWAWWPASCWRST